MLISVSNYLLVQTTCVSIIFIGHHLQYSLKSHFSAMKEMDFLKFWGQKTKMNIDKKLESNAL